MRRDRRGWIAGGETLVERLVERSFAAVDLVCSRFRIALPFGVHECARQRFEYPWRITISAICIIARNCIPAAARHASRPKAGTIHASRPGLGRNQVDRGSAEAFGAALRPQPAAPRPFDEARELIRRYPDLSDGELDRLIDLYRQFSALDMAFVLSDDELAPRLDRFSADHRSKIRLPFRQYAGLTAYAVATLAVVAWAIAVAL
jgi:hypothetical protein